MSFLKQIIAESRPTKQLSKMDMFIKNYGYKKAIVAIKESCKMGKISNKQAKCLVEAVLSSRKQYLMEEMNFDMDQYGNDKQIDFSSYDSNDIEQMDNELDDGCDVVDVDNLSPAELAQEIEDLKHDLEQASERDEDQEIIDQIISNLKCIKSAIEDKLESGHQDSENSEHSDDFDFDEYDNDEFANLDLDGYDEDQFDDFDDFGDDYDQDFEDDDFKQFNDFDDSSDMQQPSIQQRQQKQSLRDTELRRPARGMDEENEEQAMPDWMRKVIATLPNKQNMGEENEEQEIPDWMRKALGEAVSTDVDKAKSHRARVDSILRAKGSATHKSPKDYDRKKEKQLLKKEKDD